MASISLFGSQSDLPRSKTFFLACVIASTLCVKTQADLFDRFGNLIPGTESLELSPQSQFSDLDLRDVEIRGYYPETGVVNIEGSTFENSDLRRAVIWAEVKDVDFSNAVINDARIDGISEDQIKSTSSYLNNDLSGVNIYISEFNNPKSWDLRGANLQSARLEANFSNADFRGANLDGTSLSGSSEPRRELDATFQGANFTDATIRNATFFAGSLTMEQVYSSASYQSQDLRGVSFSAKPLIFSFLPYDIRGWDFHGQDMTGGSLKNADAANTDFSNATLVNGDLSFADLVGSRFRDARLLGADLYATDLTTADFRNANLASSDLRSSNVSGVDLRGVNLGNAGIEFASNLDVANFDSLSRYNQWTKFPTGFDPVAAGLSFYESPIGDFDANQTVDGTDIDLISDRIRRGNDVDYLTVEEYEEGWVIIDGRYSDFVYVSNNVVQGGVSDNDPIYERYGVRGLSTFDATTDADIDEFVASIRKDSEKNAPWLEASFDLNGDGKVSRSDKAYLLGSVLRTVVGDSNLDGEFSSRDFILVFSANEYEDGIDGNSTWATGDWSGDREFSSADLVIAFSEGRYEIGPQVAVAVAEPASNAIFTLAITIIGLIRRR